MATLDAAVGQASRTTLADMDIPLGKRVRLHRLLYEYGLRNGTMLVQPIDQGIEHGPFNFFENPPRWSTVRPASSSAVTCGSGR